MNLTGVRHRLESGRGGGSRLGFETSAFRCMESKAVRDCTCLESSVGVVRRLRVGTSVLRYGHIMEGWVNGKTTALLTRRG